MVSEGTAGNVREVRAGSGTFGEGAGVAVHLQGVQGADLQLGVVVQELLHDGLEGQQQLLLLLQLLLGGRRQHLLALRHAQLLGDVLEETVEEGAGWSAARWGERRSGCGTRPSFVPGHEDVDEALVGVKLGRDVVFDPLVDGLRGGVCLDLLQQLLLQLQQREEEAQALALQDLQHAVFVLVDFCHKQPQPQRNGQRAEEG